MPAQIPAINLLGSDTPDATVFSRMVDWITTYGRYIMVTTEIVVLGAFISRFSLDRKLTDLNEEITQKQQIIEVNQQLETEFRTAQAKIKNAKTIIATQGLPNTALQTIQRLLPTGTYIETFKESNGVIELTMVSVSTSSFGQFLSLLSSEKTLSNLAINDVGRKPIVGIAYSLTASVANPSAAK